MFLILMLVAGQVLMPDVAGKEAGKNYPGKIATTIQSIESMILEEYEKSQPQYVAALIMSNPYFNDLVPGEVSDFIKDDGANKKFELYLHTYIQDYTFLSKDSNMKQLIDAFITSYWPPSRYTDSMPARYPEGGYKDRYVDDVMSFLDCKNLIADLEFVNETFIDTLSKDSKLQANLNTAIFNRLWLVMTNNVNTHDERRFYLRLFKLLDEGTFNNDIEEFMEWRKIMQESIENISLQLNDLKKQYEYLDNL
ncbi:uncharacterized protein LOC111064509 isoform X5 [Nilaparvata lugens]|uniref:uncharacterized protein LOC111064509 isoform X5 n=1 Tax=Nilaparvata lugens TaxID=108931 RepID=UPI000B998580|nr:uncharacterized protein LOC111064509 isoform X5 [Nilaparvata lugens]